MKYATKAQVQKINILINKLQLKDDKAKIIKNYTGERTERSSLMSIEEARQLIMILVEHSPVERIKRLLFSLGYQSGILYGTTAADKKMNAAKLNMFLKERGAVKKELNAMNYSELIKIHRQFEGMVRNIKKAQDNNQAKKVVKNLLNELNLQTL
ncbi:hypothetical protein [Pedobacter antarcticus]|uniref:hypothetical protein n=1 Tax=Pedobacter antarcticus TaxID=34086 RepID=UPI00292D8F79|nr:hypothetical protein [Pedobacter antarcticus]